MGSGLERLKGVWEKSGDLWGLFHPQWVPGQPYRTEAVFDADAHFYLPLLAALRGWIAPAPATLVEGAEPATDPAPVSAYLTLDLAATLQSGPPLPDRCTGADVRPRTAHFRFRRTPAAAGGDFNDLPGGPGDDQAIRGLAYAARATSSFPGAFEPAAVFAWVDGAGAERPEDGGRPANLRSVFSEVGSAWDRSFDVMDGGVFDNIPIGRALQAIADAPAGNRTRRILVYLDPDPPVSLPAVPAPVAFAGGLRQLRAHFIGSVFTALRYKQTVESSWDDLREIGALRRVLNDRQLRRRAFLELSPELRADGPPDADLQQRYRRFRATTDAGRVVDLMTAPGVGFLRTLVPSPALASALGLDKADEARDALARALLSAPSGPGADDLAADATSLAFACDLLISWVRQLQDTSPALPGLAEAKSRLYRVRTAALFAGQCRDRAAVVAALGVGAPPPPDTPLPFDAQAALLRPAVQSTPTGGFDLASEEGLWAALAGVQPETGDAATEDDLQGLESAGWDALCAAVNLVAEPAANPILVRLAPESGAPQPLDRVRAQRLVLRTVVAIGEPGTVAVPAFFTIIGDQAAPPGAPPLPLATEAGRALELCRLARSPGGTAPTERRPVNATSKLAGVQLAAFGGFLAAEWRTHDWAWGRADGGAGLLEVLGELHPEARESPAFAAARLAVAGLYEGLDGPKPTLAGLSPGRRYALVARFGLGLQRALWPLTPRNRAGGARSGPVGLLVAAVLILLRPVLIGLPLLMRWPVLLAVGFAAALAHHLARAQAGTEATLPAGLLILPPAAVAVFAILQLVAVSGRRRRWQQLGEAAQAQALAAATPAQTEQAELDRRITNRVRGRLACAFWMDLLVLAAAVVAIIVVATTTATSYTLPWSGFDAWALAIAVAVAMAGLGRVQAAALGAPPALAWRGAAIASVLVVAAGLCVWLVGRVAIREPALAGWAPTATALVVAAVVAAVQHAWTPQRWLVGSALFAGFVAWLVLTLAGHRLDRLTDVPLLGPVLAILLPLVIAAALLGLAMVWSRWGVRADSPAGVALGLVVLVVTVVGAWLLTFAWPWLQALPLGLVLGGAVAAATTLVVPFRDAAEMPPL